MLPFASTCAILLVGACIIYFIGWIMQTHNKTRQSDDDNGATSTNSTTTNSNIFGLSLSLEDRIELYKTIFDSNGIELYKKTFDSNGNQLTLKSEHIIVTKIIPTLKEEEKDEKNDDSESFIDIDIELGDNNNRVEHDDDDDDDGDDDDDDVDYQSDCSISTITKSLCLNHTKDDKTLINGTCIICFEEFSKDDVIVWSGDSDCSHIYHKECMATYLASNSQRERKKGLSGILKVTNPCPTCRRPNYCTVRKEDLLQLIVRTTTTKTCQIMTVTDNPSEEETVSSTTFEGDNNSSTNNATSTSTTTTNTTTTNTMLSNNIGAVSVSDNRTIQYLY